MGPVSAPMERHALAWMARQAGFPAEADGVLTSGGSVGNLTALLAARQAITGRDVWDEGLARGKPLAILVPDETHYCVKRAAQILGLGKGGIFPHPRRRPLQAPPRGAPRDLRHGGADRTPGLRRRRERRLHLHRRVRPPRARRRVLPSARPVVPRGRRARRLGGAVPEVRAPRRGHRPGRFPGLGRAQDDAAPGAGDRGPFPGPRGTRTRRSPSGRTTCCATARRASGGTRRTGRSSARSG
jgi:hypothetical protein